MFELLSTKLGGLIEKLLPKEAPTFGFIRGDDGRQYFFIPSGMARLSATSFPQLLMLPSPVHVEFEPSLHPKGMRAISISVVTSAR